MHTDCRKALLLIAGSILSCLSLFAQSYNFRNYSVEEGLPFIGVSAICQDIHGNLWIGGYGGLSCFNGKTFTNYSPQNGLANHRVLSITADSSEHIWVGTQTGLSELSKNHFRNYTVKEGLPDDQINCLLTDSRKRIWIGTANGLCSYDGEKITNISHLLDAADRNVQALYEDSRHDIWVGTDKGIVVTGSNGKADLVLNTNNGLINNRVNAILQDRKGNYWIGTDKGVTCLDKNRKSTISTTALNGINVISILEDLHGNIWISTELGLWKFNGTEFKSISLGHDLNANKTSCLFLDYEKNIWIGTYAGLFRYRSADFVSYGQSEGISTPFIHQIWKDRNGNLWVSTFGGGISILKYGVFYNYSVADGLPSNAVTSVIQASDGSMWVGTDKGFCVCPPVSNPAQRFRFTRPPMKGFVKADTVNALFQDSKGVIWIGGNNGIGKYSNGIYTWIPLPAPSFFSVYYFMEDQRGDLWIGTYLGGLFRYDGKTFTSVNRELGLKSESFLAMTQDKEGVYYLGSLDGVFVYNPSVKDGSAKRVVQISEAQGLNSDLVYLMEFADKEKTLWVGTNQGLNKINLDLFKRTGTTHIITYGKEEGFTGVECNGSAVCSDHSGSIWFGTVNGLIHYNPKEYIPNKAPAKISMTRMRLFYSDTLLAANSVMAYDENNISFEYIGICLTNPDKVRYKVRLYGFDKEWSPVTSNTVATYSNLPPGHYSFQVLSCNNEGIWGAAPSVFSFSINAPFWKRWWFSMILSIVLVLMTVSYFRIRINTIRKDESLKVRMATNELKALRSQMNPHFIFNSLNSIQHFIMNSDENSAAKYLNTFAKLIRTILNNSEKPTVSLREEIDSLRLYLELESLRFENKFEYEILLDPALDMDYQEVPTMLIQPFAENAIIHGLLPKKGPGKLSIQIQQKGNFTLCSITDNGIGRGRAMELKEKSIRKTHKSFGLKITQDRLELLNFLHKSSLNIQTTDLFDEQGQPAGTRVEIYIPVS
ncbi:MAG TPA: two-component regulator propeller domain-containing protein [Bacteroidia bacterium]|jgi:ligand-binding sensor domain-containing protein|nr:two-component regulator propeller domain-containing protein [Bacteroidia bacterium]